jgi:hypothetical protein
MAFWSSVGVAEVFGNTVDTAYQLAAELPAAADPTEFFEILFADDRKIYLGVMLIGIALLFLLL